MNELGEIITAGSERELGQSNPSPPNGHASPSSSDFRIIELEIENLRLQRLIAELLFKNQQLRRAAE
ncbi:hypothetical protein P8936_07870 [Edaphobacter paludis]|uniref:Transposase n=1 Tax=Edaphobacter paludis TaxID=3035702 RepID=A0AAU7D2B5_9BACT